MKKVIQEIIYTIPEILIIIISILLLIFGFMNYKISSPPKDVNLIEENIDKTYCIPMLKLDSYDQNTKIKDTMRKAYSLMVLSIFSGFFLLCLGIFLLYNKIKHSSVIKVIDIKNNTVKQQFHSID